MRCVKVSVQLSVLVLAIAGSAASAYLQVQHTSNLSGKISIAGKTSLDLQRLSVRLSSEYGNGPDAVAGVTNDGTFILTELRDTIYRLGLAGLPDGWYVRSAALGNQNVLEDGLKLTEEKPGEHLEIAVSPGAAKIQGVVLEPVSNDLVPHALVELFPDPMNSHRANLFRAAETDESGRFRIKNVVPGKYRVIAFMGKVPSQPSYDDSLTAASAGIRITLAEKQSRNLELELFEAHK